MFRLGRLSVFARSDAACALGCGLLSLAPLLWFHALFAQLFWFGDEIVLFAEYKRIGLAKFLGALFTENFVPVFKLGLVGIAESTRGEYFAFLIALWVTHAVVVALYAGWLRQSGFSRVSLFFCGLVFGVSVTQIETLGWATQWSSVLATAFFLATCSYILTTERRPRAMAMPETILVALGCALSATSFSRGILTGPCACVLFATGPSWALLDWRGRLSRLAIIIAPSVAVAALVFFLPNPEKIYLLQKPEQWSRGLLFAVWYLAGNPMLQLTTESLLAPTAGQVWLCGGIKAAVVLAAFGLASRTQRRALLVLLLLDLGFAAQLGLGRSGGDVHLALSSRYQYTSLLTALPFLAVLIEAVLPRLSPKKSRQNIGAGAVVVLAVVAVVWTWPERLRVWAEWRGAHSRRVVFRPTTPEERSETTTAGVPTAELKELVQRYGLH